MKRKYLLLATVAGCIVTLDQLIKIYVHTHFRLGESIPVIQDFFHLTYVRNKGAAFGFLAQSPSEFRDIFFLLIPPAALTMIIYFMRSVEDKDYLQTMAFSLVFGGAIGNYFDRLRYGYVVDFLDFHYKHQFSWPAFNIADSAIVCGVILLFIMIYTRKDEIDALDT